MHWAGGGRGRKGEAARSAHGASAIPGTFNGTQRRYQGPSTRLEPHSKDSLTPNPPSHVTGLRNTCRRVKNHETPSDDLEMAPSGLWVARNTRSHFPQKSISFGPAPSPRAAGPPPPRPARQRAITRPEVAPKSTGASSDAHVGALNIGLRRQVSPQTRLGPSNRDIDSHNNTRKVPKRPVGSFPKGAPVEKVQTTPPFGCRGASLHLHLRATKTSGDRHREETRWDWGRCTVQVGQGTARSRHWAFGET